MLLVYVVWGMREVTTVFLSHPDQVADMAETGIVNWFNAKLGYGFIQRDGGEDIFVHFSAIQDGDFLAEGERVQFDIVPGPKGSMAAHLVRTD